METLALSISSERSTTERTKPTHRPSRNVTDTPHTKQTAWTIDKIQYDDHHDDDDDNTNGGTQMASDTDKIRHTIIRWITTDVVVLTVLVSVE